MAWCNKSNEDKGSSNSTTDLRVDVDEVFKQTEQAKRAESQRASAAYAHRESLKPAQLKKALREILGVKVNPTSKRTKVDGFLFGMEDYHGTKDHWGKEIPPTLCLIVLCSCGRERLYPLWKKDDLTAALRNTDYKPGTDPEKVRQQYCSCDP